MNVNGAYTDGEAKKMIKVLKALILVGDGHPVLDGPIGILHRIGQKLLCGGMKKMLLAKNKELEKPWLLKNIIAWAESLYASDKSFNRRLGGPVLRNREK